MTSESARFRSGSRSTWTRSIRWSIRPTSARASTGSTEPNNAPGATVEWSLSDFRQELKKGKAELIPWLQDFSYGRTYKLADVKAQIEAARLMGARGYLLWNPLGIYTPGALAPA